MALNLVKELRLEDAGLIELFEKGSSGDDGPGEVYAYAASAVEVCYAFVDDVEWLAERNRSPLGRANGGEWRWGWRLTAKKAAKEFIDGALAARATRLFGEGLEEVVWTSRRPGNRRHERLQGRPSRGRATTPIWRDVVSPATQNSVGRGRRLRSR